MRSDKRPFFTENQSFFYVHIPPTNYPVYTRRIGATRDDGRGPSEIDGALKITGSTSSLNYGFITAHEAEDVGRSFYIGRVTLPAEKWCLGLLSTYVDRPFLDRTALVNSLDFDYKPNDVWHLQTQFLDSEIDKAKKHSSGYGAWTILEFSPNEHWLQRAMLVWYDETLDFNDMGYMARNNYVSYYLWNQYRKTDFPADSRKASVTWVLRSVIDRTTDNLHLPVVSWLQRTEKMRSGADLSSQITLNYQGFDDLISRGNGDVYLNNRWTINTTYTKQRKGAWRYSVGAQLFQEGYEDWGIGFTSSITWYPYEKLNFDFQLNPRWSRDWLIWMHHDLLASFSKQQVTGQIGAAWFPAEDHEIRLLTQWYVINADAKQGYRIGSAGRLVASNDLINSFAMINFALQLRYRYEIAPLSDLYLVYSRGGIDRIDKSDQSTLNLLGQSTGLRDSDQILVKLRYRF